MQKCFFRQFFHSVEKVDYLTLRHGFVAVSTVLLFKKFLFPISSSFKYYDCYWFKLVLIIIKTQRTYCKMTTFEVHFKNFADSFVRKQRIIQLPAVHTTVAGGRFPSSCWHKVVDYNNLYTTFY